MDFVPIEDDLVGDGEGLDSDSFTVKSNFPKRPIEEINVDAETIDPQKVATQTINLVAKRVETFIDNHETSFKIDIIGLEDEPEEEFGELRKFQDLYRSIPDDDEVVDAETIAKLEAGEITMAELLDGHPELDAPIECRDKLNEITEQVFEAMPEQKDAMDNLFNRMAFYYEAQGYREGELIVQEMEGFVEIIKFEYEAFSMGVRSVDKLTGEVREYLSPEGFILWLEIAFQPKDRPRSMF